MNNNVYIAVMIIVMFWLVTLLNLKGMKYGSMISSVEFIVGVIIPFFLILGFGMVYFMVNNLIELPPFSWKAALPNFSSLSNLRFFVGIIFLYAGIEVSAVHANEVKNPSHNYPIAMLIAVILVLVLNVLGAFSIEIFEPKNDISLASGIMQTFAIFITKKGVTWLIPIVAGMAAISAIMCILM